MINKIFSYLLCAALLFTSITPAFALNLCETQQGFSALFFNGVWNTSNDANRAMFVLESTLGSTHNDEPITYDLMYNSTGEANGASAFEDIAEVFIQRANELDVDPTKHFDLFMEAVTSGGSGGFFDKVAGILGSVSSTLLGLLEDMYSALTISMAGALSHLLSNPPTIRDYNRHTLRLRDLSLTGRKMLMIAHSQGNLFMNNAYDTVLGFTNISSANVAAVHIAPASLVTNGDHVLANIDVVINGLRAFGTSSVPPVTVELPLSHLTVDKSGHELIATYLKPGLAAVTQISNASKAAMDALVAPVALASNGAFTATLEWNGSGDIDLHTFEPNGTHVYYSNRRGPVGYLDVDNTQGFGPEHYFANCDSDILEEGVYTIGLNNYAAPDGITASVQISTPQTPDIVTKQLQMGSARGRGGNSSPMTLLTVTVTKVDGKVNITAQ